MPSSCFFFASKSSGVITCRGSESSLRPSSLASSELRRDNSNQGSDDAAADLEQTAMESAEPFVHFLAQGVDLLPDQVGLASQQRDVCVNPLEAVVETLVCPAVPHRLNDYSIVDKTIRTNVARKANCWQNFCRESRAADF